MIKKESLLFDWIILHIMCIDIVYKGHKGILCIYSNMKDLRFQNKKMSIFFNFLIGIHEQEFSFLKYIYSKSPTIIDQNTIQITFHSLPFLKQYLI